MVKATTVEKMARPRAMTKNYSMATVRELLSFRLLLSLLPETLDRRFAPSIPSVRGTTCCLRLFTLGLAWSWRESRTSSQSRLMISCGVTLKYSYLENAFQTLQKSRFSFSCVKVHTSYPRKLYASLWSILVKFVALRVLKLCCAGAT